LIIAVFLVRVIPWYMRWLCIAEVVSGSSLSIIPAPLDGVDGNQSMESPTMK
jgi:hypothetical protein